MSLILGIGINQSFMIGDNVKVTVSAIKDHQVKVAIDAPREIPVHREKIWLKIQNEKLMGGGNKIC